ncbi:MAG: hypothetical protein AAB817_01655, partial [Patescibacteria group bacterium]
LELQGRVWLKMQKNNFTGNDAKKNIGYLRPDTLADLLSNEQEITEVLGSQIVSMMKRVAGEKGVKIGESSMNAIKAEVEDEIKKVAARAKTT